MNWTAIRERILATLAAEMIPTVERIAIALLIRNGEQLRDKADLALDLMMAEYKKLTADTPLGMTDMDDQILRGLAEKALARAWVQIDAQVKQAARDVKASLPAPAPGGVVVTDPYVPPTRRPIEDGVTPTTAADHGADIHPTPPMESD